MSSPGQAWTEPGAYDVAPGVWRIPLPLPNDGLRAVNVYALATDDGLTLIDGGWAIPASRDQLAAALDGLGWSLGDVRRFLVTHSHRDHYTQAIAIRSVFGASVAIGVGEQPTLTLLQHREREALTGHLDLLRELGAPNLAEQIEAGSRQRPVDLTHWELPDEWLDEGTIALAGGRRLEAIATPGHTAGHLVFADDDAALLFAGDHVLPTITPSIGFEPIRTADPLGAFLRSLALVRRRPDALLLPAHGPVAPSVHGRIDELIDHHGRRLDETERAVHAGADSAFEVAARLTWTRRRHRLADLDVFNAMLAVFETGAHLDLLVSQGRLAVASDQGVYRYR